MTVYDSGSQQIFHYLNGKEVGVTKAPKKIPVRIGMAEIGNWRPGNRTHDKNKIRSLNGRMDEFLLLKRALSVGEIRAMYRVGTPNP